MSISRDTKIRPNSRALWLSAAFLLCFGFNLTGPAQAAVVPAASPCDPEYNRSLNARAWLEAQREVTQNQNLIYKPDSVLEYTCFNEYLNVLGRQAESMFSESGRWSSRLSDTHMDNALGGLMGGAIRNYLNSNFDNRSGGKYALLGGRFSDTGANATNMSPANLDHDPPQSSPYVSGAGYGCDVMNQVWMAAKCVDFIANASNDGFYTFANYQASGDRRFLPQACTAVGARWDLEMRASTGVNTPWTEDSFLSFVENFKHKVNPTASAASGCQHIRPVPTGLQVFSREYPTYNEYVCLAPGCYYKPAAAGGATVGTCVRSNAPP